MSSKSLLSRLLYAARNFRSRALFESLERYCDGDVLDVGGWDFFLTARQRGARYTTWTTLDNTADRLPDVDDPAFRIVVGDGTAMDFADGSFDTALNVQVLEHVFEPIRMVEEIGRVLRPGGHAIFLIPQTPDTHLAPNYHSGFSRYWIERAMARARLEVVELQPLGGAWSTIASRTFYLFLHALRIRGFSDPVHRRKPAFYVLFPFMVLWGAISIPVSLLLGLGDLTEEPNNHLVVARKGS